MPDPVVLQAVDAVILAGDIYKGVQGIEWARRSFGNCPVLYVAGNHEFYGHHWVQLLDELRATARQWDVHFLEDDSVCLGGVRFLGCSLWTDFEYFGAHTREVAMQDAAARMNDYHLIHADPLPGDDRAGQKHRLSPWQALQRHRRSLDWLKGELATEFDGRTVVVTHRYPSPRSTAVEFKDHPLNAAFGSNLPEALIGQADLWVHGHTHSSHDYWIEAETGRARVLCNPRGYPLRGGSGRFENEAFDPRLTVDV